MSGEDTEQRPGLLSLGSTSHRGEASAWVPSSPQGAVKAWSAGPPAVRAQDRVRVQDLTSAALMLDEATLCLGQSHPAPAPPRQETRTAAQSSVYGQTLAEGVEVALGLCPS